MGTSNLLGSFAFALGSVVLESTADPHLVPVPTKRFETIHNNCSVPEGTGMRRSWEGLGRPSFFMLLAR